MSKRKSSKTPPLDNVVSTPLRDTMKTYTVVLPRDLAQEVDAFMLERNVEISTFVRLALRAMKKAPLVHGLHDRINFGKYRGEPIADIIKIDPRYVAWVAGNVDHFKLTDEAMELLQSMLDHDKVEPPEFPPSDRDGEYDL